MYIILIVSLLGYSNASPNLTGCQESSWYSDEEGYPPDKLTGYPMTGLKCQSDRCNELM